MSAEITAPVALAAGIVSFASPCFLPVVPAFVGYMVGQGASTAADGPSDVPKRSTLRLTAVGHALAFVAAFSAVFILLWAMVGFVGWAVSDYRSALRVGGGIVLVLLGLYTAEFIRIPFLDQTMRVPYHPAMKERPTYRRSLLLGLAFGAGWTPCIGPVLGGVLGLTVSADSVGTGLGLLLIYSLGLGIPFVLVCAGVTGVTRRLSWFTRHRRGVNIATGMMLLVIGFLMISDLFAKFPALTSTL